MHTAYGREEILREASSKGIIKMPLLIKPVTQSALLDSIAEGLGRSMHRRHRNADRQNQQDFLDSIRQLQGTHVLLVEDNELNQELALALLTGHGISVEVAINGQEAVDMLGQSQYDGVLMDCQMPVMDGYTATQVIRQQLQLMDLPVIAMTANAMLSDIEKVKQVGMNDHIAKPVNVQDMFNTMARWIKPSGSVPVDQVIEAEQNITRGSTDIALPDISGLDTRAALARVGGNKRFYIKLLKLFADRQPGKNITTHEALAAGRWKEVKNAAHEAKGVLGSIGATVLQEAASELQSLVEQEADEKQLKQKAEHFCISWMSFSTL